MKKIKCQAKHTKDGGCATCGGYKVVMAIRECPNCGHGAWVRPGAYTSYPGKVWTTIDGVQVTDGGGTDTGYCSKCPAASQRERAR